ncbi:peptidoglycan-binding domain-containing protein [Nakamurella antarctica]|uniref:peptidoglycan-binding domain-containing protein n=1 Tax=Nakamurella antarctica TaxID=1902245 RepID=UPI0013DDEE18|nr:peptidoglycan-binding domain-containing protein [Nakamurella antarctica]
MPNLPEVPAQSAQSPDLLAGSTAAGMETGNGEAFMDVANWEPERTTPTNTAGWIVGALAALAVVAVLVAIVFVVVDNKSAKSVALPDAPPSRTSSTSTVQTTPTSRSAPSATSANAIAPPQSAAPIATTEITVTVEAQASVPSADAATSAASLTSSAETTAPISMDAPLNYGRGGPDREIACNSGYIVQVASAVSDADFEALVAQLRAANELPANISVASTGGSCQIFSSQTNTIVAYAGPFPDKYAACAARLAAAPDSFIRGTTPETAREYVSCLCPAGIDTLPVITDGSTGAWVGELQRVLANKLNYKIPDVNAVWGTYSASTREAVTRFQTDEGLPASGQVDAATWQRLQGAQC